MCPWVWSHALSCGWQLCGLPSRILGVSSCTPNAPNLDHAKKNSFSPALFFENRILVQRKYPSYHLCHFVPFFGQPKTKKNFPKINKSYDFSGK